MRIETERLLLRPFASSDGAALCEYLSQPETVQYEPYDVFSKEQAVKEAASRADDPAFVAVCLKGEGKLIGNLYFGERPFGSRELGFVFNSRYWGQGFAAEAAKALLDAAFREGVHRVFAECNPENRRSWQLLERLGMRREGELRQNIWFFKDGQGNPRWQDTFLYAILQEEWLRQAAGTARKRNIVLIGLSGCGKTTLAPVLSEALGMPAVEMDDEIVKEAGKPISAIFAEDGEKAFRDMETACAKRCAGMDGVIISTGGGVVLREENMAALSQNGLVVFLDRAPMAIAGEDLADRPLLAQNRRNIFSLYEQRIGLYRRYAEVTVENNGPISETTKVLLQKIKEARAWKN